MASNSENSKKGVRHWTPWLDEEPEPEPSLQVDAISRTIIILAVGIIVGVAITSIGLRSLADKLDELIVGFISVVIFIGAVTVWIVFNKDKILEKIFGVKGTDLSDLKFHGIHLINNLSEKNYDAAEKNLSYLSSKTMAWYVWFSFRRWILIVFQALFIGFGGLLGTILLFSQNLLIEQQTIRLDKQNELIEKQNEHIDQQTYLQEADRRSALVFRMDNTWNEVDRELKTDIGRPRVRDLSPELITRIVTLCEMLRPYRYLQGGVLSASELSPERGQVLITLANSNLDTITLKAIFEKGNFRFSDLAGVNFRNAFLKGAALGHAALNQSLFSKANLTAADLSKAKLLQADFTGANLERTDFSNAELKQANFYNARLWRANFSKANLRQARFSGADLREANLSGARLQGVNFEGADLRGAIVGPDWAEILTRTGTDSIYGRQYLQDYFLIDSLRVEGKPIYKLRAVQASRK
jgi:hypothetical protein